jgi:hypothetical protein
MFNTLRALEKFKDILKSRLKLRNFAKIAAPRKWSWNRIVFHFGNKLVQRKKRAKEKSSQKSNVAMRIQFYVNIKEENVEEWMYFLKGATRHLTKKCKYGSDVIWDIAWINACMLRPSFGRVLYRPREEGREKGYAGLLEKSGLNRRAGFKKSWLE